MQVPKVTLQDPTKLQAPPVPHLLYLSFFKLSPDGGVGTLAPSHAKTEDQLAQVEVGDPPTREAYRAVYQLESKKWEVLRDVFQKTKKP